MKNCKTITPGFCFIHSNIKKIMSGQSPLGLKLTCREADLIKKKLDDYLMYIWALMGDTRYNRSGYRAAFESLEKLINKNF